MTGSLDIDPDAVIDAEAFARVHAAAVGDDRRAWSANEFAGFERQRAEERVVAATARGGDGSLTGFALWRPIVDEAELLLICRLPQSRGWRVGDALMRAFVEIATARGMARITLEVAEDNAPALALYRRAGFEPLSRRKAYYADNAGARVDALILSKPLIKGK